LAWIRRHPTERERLRSFLTTSNTRGLGELAARLFDS
jgi:hypothetical protein